MTILSVQETTINQDHVTVTAVVEDTHLVSQQTYMDPPEYGPGLCQATFYINDDETLPLDEPGFINYLDKLDLDWSPLRVDPYDYF